MAKIVGQHADDSDCYTPGCSRMVTGMPRQPTAQALAAFAADYVTQAPLAKTGTGCEPLPTYKDPDEQAWWEGIRAAHETTVVAGREFTLAPAGVSGVYCFECNAYLPEGSLAGASARAVTCPNCGEACKSGLTGISIRHDNRWYLQGDAVLGARWFHTSSRPDWAEAAGANPMVHLGSRDAALDRVADIDHYDRQVYLYEVAFEPGTPVDGRLFEEDQFDPGQNNFVPDHEQAGVNRYLNYYENPGSISLYASRGAFRVVGRTAVDA